MSYTRCFVGLSSSISLVAIVFVMLALMAEPISAKNHKKSRAQGLETSIVEEGPANTNGGQESYVVTQEYSVTFEGKSSKNKAQGRRHRANSRKQVSKEAITVQRNGTRVTLYPTLGIQDYGNSESVRGQVYSSTTANAKDVNSMRIGGALLQAGTCATIYSDPSPIPTETTVTKVKQGTSPWTSWFGGFNSCWVQTGHNYFKIKLDNGNVWNSYVTGDAYIDL